MITAEYTADGIRLASRDGKYSRWFILPWEDVNGLIADLTLLQWEHDTTE